MRRFVAALSAALLLGSTTTAALAGEPVAADGSGAPITVLRVNTTMRSVLSPSNPEVVRIDGRYAEVYSFEVQRGQCAEFVMRSDEVDSLVVLQGAGGYELAKDDDSGGGRDAFLRGTFNEAGPVWVVATTAEPNQTGQYTLAVRTCDGLPLTRPRAPVQPAPPPANPSTRQTPTQMM
jgi:hypothetical protein